MTCGVGFWTALFLKFFGSVQKTKNSQTEAERGGPSSQELHSQTPPLSSTLRTEGGSDDEDDKEEEQTSGTVWGHVRLSRSVCVNNPQPVSVR